MRILVDVAADRLRLDIIEMLERAGHTVERAAHPKGTGSPCGSLAPNGAAFDLVLVGTPEVAERLRRTHPTDAIIVVTRIGDVPARIRALEVGADDAFDTSFPPSQIAARVGAAGRRAAMIPRPPERLAIDGCEIHSSASLAVRDYRMISLTSREVEIIRWLSQHAGQVVTRGELLQHVWRVAAGNTTRAVDVAIAGLRAKIERVPDEPVIIVSVRGAGYRWG